MFGSGCTLDLAVDVVNLPCFALICLHDIHRVWIAASLMV